MSADKKTWKRRVFWLVAATVITTLTMSAMSLIGGRDWLGMVGLKGEVHLKKLPYDFDPEKIRGEKAPHQNPYWTEGRPALVDGEYRDHAVAMHPETNLTGWAKWKVPPRYRYFSTGVVLHDDGHECNGQGSVRFIVKLDDEVVERVIIRRDNPILGISRELNGARELTLETDDAGDNIVCDGALWLNARFTKTEPRDW